MKNVWKGLVVGALTGAGVGLLLDLLEALGHRGQELSASARDEAAHLASVAETKVREAELPDKVREVTDRIKDAGLPDRVKQTAETVTANVHQAADAVSDKVGDSDLADRAKRVTASVNDIR